MNAATFRKLALSLGDVAEKPHFERTAFRTPKRIFATMGQGGKEVNLKLDPDLQSAVVATSPAFSKIPNKWGDQGWTQCLLSKVSAAQLKSALKYAYSLACEEKLTKKVRSKSRASLKT